MSRNESAWEAMESLEARRLLAFVLWDGGGGDHEWANPLNWSGDALPGATDHVLIDAPGFDTIRRSGGDDTIASLWTFDPLEFSGGALTVAGEWRQSAAFTMSGGRVLGAGHFQLNGDMIWSGGSFEGTGRFLVNPGRHLSIAGDVLLARELINNGSMTWSAGNLSTDGARIRNLPDRTFLIQSAGVLSSVGAPSYMTNYGTLIRDGAAGTATVVGVSFSNASGFGTFPAPPYGPGTVEVRSGTLSFAGSVVQKEGTALYGGIWKVTSSAGELLLPGPTLTTAAGVFVLSGAGASFPALETATEVWDLTVSGGRAFTFPNMRAAGIISTGRLVIDNPGMAVILPQVYANYLEIEAGNVSINGGLFGQWIEVGAAGTLTISGQSRVPYAQISGAGLIRLLGEMTIVSGLIQGPGQLVIGPSGRLMTQGFYYESGDIILNRRIVNYGVVTLSPSGWYGFGAVSLTGEFVNRGTLNLDITGYLSTTAGIGPGIAPGFITNFGTVHTSGNLTMRGAGGGIRVNNAGTFHIHSGLLILNGGTSGGGAWIVEPGGELAFGGFGGALAGASFSGTGRIRVASPLALTSASISGAGELLVTVPGRLSLIGVSSLFRSAVTNNGLIRFEGTAGLNLTSNFVNNAELSVGTGLLAVSGNLTLTANSHVRMVSAGPSEGARITVSGHATLGGRLTAAFTWPAPAATLVNVLTAGSNSGVFASVVGTGLPPNELVLFEFVGVSGRLRVVTL